MKITVIWLSVVICSPEPCVPRSDPGDYSPAIFLCTTNLYFTHDETIFIFAKYFYYYYFSNLYLFIRCDIYNNKMWFGTWQTFLVVVVYFCPSSGAPLRGFTEENDHQTATCTRSTGANVCSAVFMYFPTQRQCKPFQNNLLFVICKTKYNCQCEYLRLWRDEMIRRFNLRLKKWMI